MARAIGLTMVVVLLALIAVPAVAGPVAPSALSDDEVSTFTVQDSNAVDTVGDVAGGLTYDQETFLTVAGVVIVAVILIVIIF